MIQKDITYTDLDGNQAKAIWHFGISKSELAELKLSHRGDIVEYFNAIVKNEDGASLIENFKKIIMLAVGKREGQRFVKNDDLRDEFLQTGAYDSFFMELIQSKDGGATVLTGMLPSDLAQQVEEKKLPEGFTDEELLAMSDDEFTNAVGSNAAAWDKRILQIAMQRKAA
ncbi:hypothetical protein SEA_ROSAASANTEWAA_32 [Streptomyces phage RosaAsantewaa]|nr:hypothetical protein SEA_ROSAASANTEWAA_32 [Streptomyces phage RosaAsantewaa]